VAPSVVILIDQEGAKAIGARPARLSDDAVVVRQCLADRDRLPQTVEILHAVFSPSTSQGSFVFGFHLARG